MRTKEFLSKLEHDRIVGAIREAESKTSGQIRVFIQRGKLDVDPLVAAQKKFHRLGMHKTRERNAILIFVAPQRLVDGMREHFRNEKFSHALVEAIQEAGKALASHFPKRSTSSDQLPDDVSER